MSIPALMPMRTASLEVAARWSRACRLFEILVVGDDYAVESQLVAQQSGQNSAAGVHRFVVDDSGIDHHGVCSGVEGLPERR